MSNEDVVESTDPAQEPADPLMKIHEAIVAVHWSIKDVVDVLTTVAGPGPKGEQGEPGPQGAQGDPGPQGDRGDQGPQGVQGERGPEGPQGEEGPKGDTGSQGVPGQEGPQGHTGPEGPQGERGPAGTQGVQGERGPRGERGRQGLQGPAGLKGPQGLKGDEGPEGPKGDDCVEHTHPEPVQCFFPGTLICMADGGWKRVEDVEVGDRVQSPDGPREVVALDKNVFSEAASKPKAEITFRVHGSGLTHAIVCTANHPFALPDGSFGAIDPNLQGSTRLFHPVVANDGRREPWFRGNRGSVKTLSVGDEVAVAHGDAATITDVRVFEYDDDQRVPVTSPVTGGVLILAGGILASGGYDPATAHMDDPREVVRYFSENRHAAAA